MIIDAQVHAYERNHPGRPWAGHIPGQTEVTGAAMVAAMDAVGVDGALLTSPWSLYRYDPSYAITVHAVYPDRFRLVTPVDPEKDDTTNIIAEWANTPGAVGIRIVPQQVGSSAIEGPGIDRVMTAAAQHDLPVCVSGGGWLPQLGQLAANYPDTQLVIDHLGMSAGTEPFADLPELLAQACHPNLAVKVTGTARLSHQFFPFDDLWEPLTRVFEAFGIDRCMWGTDWTTYGGDRYSYIDAVAAFRDSERLSVQERAALMGGTLQRIFRWAPVVAVE